MAMKNILIQGVARRVQLKINKVFLLLSLKIKVVNKLQHKSSRAGRAGWQLADWMASRVWNEFNKVIF